MAKRPTLNQAWEAICSRYVRPDAAISYVTKKQIVRIAKRDLRLTHKFDTREALPEPLRRRGLFILPCSATKFALVRADGYHDLERLGRTTRFRSGLPFQSKVLQVGEGEATYLNRAYHSGLVEHYLGRKGYLHHYPGRQTSGQFSFMVGPLGPISVSKVQVEVDAIFESRNSIILTEAKVRSVASFLVRQLYYPYRKWLSAAADRNVQLLFFYHDPAADRYGFWTYRLTDPGDYASIVLVRKRAIWILGEIGDPRRKLAPHACPSADPNRLTTPGPYLRPMTSRRSPDFRSWCKGARTTAARSPEHWASP